MLKIAALLPLLLLASSPAYALTDRATAIETLAGVYNSVQACNLLISRAKVDAYADAARAPDDTMFNIEVWRATTALTESQKDWTDEHLKAYCATAAGNAERLALSIH